MVAKMICRKCSKITPLKIKDLHYTNGIRKGVTVLYEQTCCGGGGRWTKDYLIDHPEYKFQDWRDKNGC